MSLSDPIGNMLTQIRNAIIVNKNDVNVPFSKIKKKILEILYKKGYIKNFTVLSETKVKSINVELKYINNISIIQSIQRKSRPGLRMYFQSKKIPKILAGNGLLIISTPCGIITDNEAREKNVGGEVLLSIW